MGSKQSRATRNDIRKYQTISKASCQVYEAFKKACTKHTEHMAYFRTEVEQIILDKDSSPQVKFDMAFTHRVLPDTSSGDPIWFLVDSIINEHMHACTSMQTTCIDELEKTLKRQLTPPPTQAAKRVKKRVTFASAVPVSLPTLNLPPLTSALACIGTDFCDYIRRHFRQPLISDACLVLENTAQCKQLVYPSHYTACSELRKGTSLGQLITSTKKPGSVDGILLHERVALAKMLAIAVLQYHSTPWLRQSWRSDDIFFFSVEANTQLTKRPSLSAPYINAKIKENSTQVSDQRPTIARNPMLFSLGVVFLELAHSASLESLKLPCDADNGQPLSDFFTARRLAKSKHSLMGNVYNNIAEQLVESAFPCGDDLNDSELQIAFYEEVICPLEELEQGLLKLYIGGPAD